MRIFHSKPIERDIITVNALAITCEYSDDDIAVTRFSVISQPGKAGFFDFASIIHF